MNVLSANSPKWENELHTALSLEVRFEGESEDWPFTASATDAEAHGRELFTRAVAGEFGTVAEYVAPIMPTPNTLSMKQARLALFNSGLYDRVNQAVALAPRNVQIEWEFSQTVVRSDPLVASLATQLSLTSEQLDALFLAGSKL